MYRCSVRELSVRNDGQSESEHANLIDVPLVYYITWQTGSICVLNTIFEHWICSSGSTDTHQTASSLIFCSKIRRETRKEELETTSACQRNTRLLHSPLVCHACRHAHFPCGFSSKLEERLLAVQIHTRPVLFRNAARLKLQFDMLYLNAGICPSGSNDDRSPMELSLRYV